MNLEMRNNYLLSETEADVIALAGDISTGIRGIEFAIHQSQFHNKPVISVAGNHEFYHHDDDDLFSEIRAMVERHKNIYFLECDELMNDGVSFLGTTFWTDYRAGQREYKQNGKYGHFPASFGCSLTYYEK